MKSLEVLLCSYGLNSLWQVPLLFLAGWLAAGALRPAGARAEHRVWVCVLLLQSTLPAASLLPSAGLRTLALWVRSEATPGAGHVSTVMGAGTAAGVLHLPTALLRLAALGYAAATAYFLVQFAWRGWALVALRRGAEALMLFGPAAAYWARCAEGFGVRTARVARSPWIFGPVTLGVRRKLVLLPPGMPANSPATEAAIAHEFAHMERNDFAKNLLYECLSLPVRYHPLSALTRNRMSESREMVCDQRAADFLGRQLYRHSLLRLASLLVEQTPATPSHAIGLLDANTLERRLMRLTEEQKELRGARRVAGAAACILLGAVVCGSALALGVPSNWASTENVGRAGEAAGPVAVSSGLMAGHILTKVTPKYPEAAKKAKIQGTVLLDAVIGTDGTVEKLTVASGPDELRPSALDAVRQWTYQPFLLNGDPVEVKTTVEITYTLAP